MKKQGYNKHEYTIITASKDDTLAIKKHLETTELVINDLRSKNAWVYNMDTTSWGDILRIKHSVIYWQNGKNNPNKGRLFAAQNMYTCHYVAYNTIDETPELAETITSVLALRFFEEVLKVHPKSSMDEPARSVYTTNGIISAMYIVAWNEIIDKE